MKKAYFYNTKMGWILITQDQDGISELSLATEQQAKQAAQQLCEDYKLEETELIRETAKQLTEYLEGARREFDIKLNPTGTPFQKKVWEALCTIPYGETRSYMQIAEAIGNKNASRAVGMANHNNKVMCIIPCHRVIGSNGKLVGYAGGLKLKEYLLNLERERK